MHEFPYIYSSIRINFFFDFVEIYVKINSTATSTETQEKADVRHQIYIDRILMTESDIEAFLAKIHRECEKNTRQR